MLGVAKEPQSDWFFGFILQKTEINTEFYVPKPNQTQISYFGSANRTGLYGLRAELLP